MTCSSFEEQKGTKYIRRSVYFGIIIFSFLLSAKVFFRFLLICFAREIKHFYQSSIENKVDFTNIMNFYPNTLAKNKNKKVKKLRHAFLDERPMITTTLISLCCLKTLTFYLAKEKTWKSVFNTNIDLLENCTEKKVMSFKRKVNRLLNDIWCYLVIACFVI